MAHFTKFESRTVHHKPVSAMIFTHVLGIIESPVKSLVATVTGLITSFIPTMITEFVGPHMSYLETFLQIGVLLISLMLGITSLITWWQKQVDRRKKLKEELKKLKNETN